MRSTKREQTLLTLSRQVSAIRAAGVRAAERKAPHVTGCDAGGELVTTTNRGSYVFQAPTARF